MVEMIRIDEKREERLEVWTGEFGQYLDDATIGRRRRFVQVYAAQRNRQRQVFVQMTLRRNQHGIF